MYLNVYMNPAKTCATKTTVEALKDERGISQMTREPYDSNDSPSTANQGWKNTTEKSTPSGQKENQFFKDWYQAWAERSAKPK